MLGQPTVLGYLEKIMAQQSVDVGGRWSLTRSDQDLSDVPVLLT